MVKVSLWFAFNDVDLERKYNNFLFKGDYSGPRITLLLLMVSAIVNLIFNLIRASTRSFIGIPGNDWQVIHASAAIVLYGIFWMVANKHKKQWFTLESFHQFQFSKCKCAGKTHIESQSFQQIHIHHGQIQLSF